MVDIDKVKRANGLTAINWSQNILRSGFNFAKNAVSVATSIRYFFSSEMRPADFGFANSGSSMACTKISTYLAEESGQPCVINIWTGDGFYRESIDAILSESYHCELPAESTTS